MLYLILLLYFAVILALMAEKRINDHALSSFRFIIHVNGIRGKTDVCRRLDACLRANGLRVFTKTTGTRPCYLDTNGTEHPIARAGRANIREQFRIIRKAARDHADVLIIECMAVCPELQEVCQRQIVKSRYVVVTNLRHDHLFELGRTQDEIARALSRTVPTHGTLFLGEASCLPIFEQACAEQGSQLCVCVPRPAPDPLLENQDLADQICAHLGFQTGRGTPVNDFGAARLYNLLGSQKQHIEFLNLFSVNDPDSTHIQLQGRTDWRNTVFLYNHRADRPDRFLLFKEHFFPQFPDAQIWVMGSGSQLPMRLMAREGRSIRRCRWQDILSLPANTLIVGIGNIKGQGEALVLYAEETSVHE